MKQLYKCPACGYLEKYKIRTTGKVDRDMLKFQYSPTPGKYIKCPKCESRTGLYGWGADILKTWISAGQKELELT